MQQSIGEVLKEILTIQRKKTLIVDSLTGKSDSYEQVFKKALIVKKNLEDMGVSAKDKIIVILENSIELVYLYFSGLLDDFIIVPIEPQKGYQEIVSIVNTFSKSYVLSHQNYDFPNHVQLEFATVFKNREVDYETVEKCLMKKDFSKPYLITFTSGTTGVPKGVIHSFTNLFTSLDALAKAIGLKENTILYHHLPMTYMAGILNCIAMPLACRGSVVIGRRFDSLAATNFWDTIACYGVNTLWLNPTMIALILKLDRSNEGLVYLENHNITVMSLSAKLLPHVRTAFETKYNLTIYETYALSELLFVATNSAQTMNLIGCAGMLLNEAKVQLNISDHELEVSVPWRFLGYTNDDTENYFNGEYYKTGDIGYLDDALLYITDRKKDLIIRGGFNLSASRIKQVLLDEGIGESEAVGIKDDILGERVVCFYTKAVKPSKFRLNQVLAMRVGKEYQIDALVHIDSIPHNINGKVDKNLLKVMGETFC